MIPSNLVSITVSGTYTDISGNPLSGTVSFKASEVVTDHAGTTILGVGPITIRLSFNGKFTVTLPCTDNSNLTPTNFNYVFTENITGLNRSFTISLPSSLGQSVDISRVLP